MPLFDVAKEVRQRIASIIAGDPEIDEVVILRSNLGEPEAPEIDDADLEGSSWIRGTFSGAGSEQITMGSGGSQGHMDGGVCMLEIAVPKDVGDGFWQKISKKLKEGFEAADDEVTDDGAEISYLPPPDEGLPQQEGEWFKGVLTIFWIEMR